MAFLEVNNIKKSFGKNDGASIKGEKKYRRKNVF